jgi:hypothetical protein
VRPEGRLQLGREGAQLGIQVERGVDRVGQRLGQVGPDLGQGLYLRVDGPGGRGGPVADAGVLARQALVHGHRQRVDVRCGSRPHARGLLGGHVPERPEHVPGAGQRALPVDAGDPEVDQLRLAAGCDQNVLRLDVAVDDAVAMSVGQRGGTVGAE